MLSTDERLSASLRWHWEPFRRRAVEADAIPVRVYVREEDQRRETPTYSYFRGQDLIQQNTSIEHLFRFILWDLSYQTSQNVRAFLSLHAGAVGSPEGSLLLPAPPDTGKSTLVAALLQEGFSYLSDEVGALDPVTGNSYPFPKRLALDEAAVDFFPDLEQRLQDRTVPPLPAAARYVRPEDLGATVASPSPVRAIIFLAPERGGRPELSPVPKAEAVEGMARNCFNLFRYRDRGVVLLGRVASRAETYRLKGGTVHEQAELLVERFLGP